MNQSTIIEALQKALANGSGSLDDLENLLKRAQNDVAKAKDEEKQAKEKAEAEKKARGLKIADLANRILEGKTTDDDCAYVINSWMKARGIKGELTGKDLNEIFTNCDAAANKVTEDINKAIDDVVNSLADLAGYLDVDLNKNKKNAAAKPKAKPADKPEDVIDSFLKSFGLR